MPRVIVFVLALESIVSVRNQDWNRADRATHRLAPTVFVELPTAVRSELERRGCTIPQPFTAKRPENVIKGRFTTAGQTDWAVLCSRQRVSSILVFRGGAASAPVEIGSAPDLNSLQTIDGNGAVGYSRAIAVASSRYIQEHYRTHGGPRPPQIAHDGINDLFIEKGSLVWYWYQGRWLRLQGAD